MRSTQLQENYAYSNVCSFVLRGVLILAEWHSGEIRAWPPGMYVNRDRIANETIYRATVNKMFQVRS